MADDTDDNVQLATGATPTTFTAATKVVSAKHHALPILAAEDGTPVIDHLVATLEAIQTAAEAIRSAAEAMADISGAIGATASATSPDYSDEAANHALSVSEFGGLRVLLQTDLGENIDLGVAAPTYVNPDGAAAPRLALPNDTSPHQILAAGGTGIFYDLVGFKVYNPSGNNTVVVQILDDTSPVDEVVVAGGAQDGWLDAGAYSPQAVANRAWNVKFLSASQSNVIVKAWFRLRPDAG